MRVRETLLIPGPVSVDPRVLAAMAEPVRAHYGDDWLERYRALTAALARLFRTDGDIMLMFGPASAALEACMASTLGRGDEILVASNGFFGDRPCEGAPALR